METDSTSERIVTGALTAFLRQGVRRTSLAEVAFEAGVTRVTVYRYFGDKERLVRAVCMRITAAFARAAAGKADESTREIDARLSRLGMELDALPKGDLLPRLEEIRRLYPAVYEEFRAVRQASVDAIFRQALAAATRDATLRDDLNQEVLKAIFWASVVGLLENPALISSNVPLAEIVATVTEVFRHGILKTEEAKRD